MTEGVEEGTGKNGVVTGGGVEVEGRGRGGGGVEGRAGVEDHVREGGTVEVREEVGGEGIRQHREDEGG